jgi:hypothetical protein
MSEREFAHFSLPPKAQARAHVAHLGGLQWLKELSSCNCAEGHCYYPWAKHTPHFSPCHFPETMPDVVNTDNPIQGMLSHAAMMSSRKKTQRLSAYEADPITMDDCFKSKNWETPEAGNSWKEAILNEIGNLLKF